MSDEHSPSLIAGSVSSAASQERGQRDARDEDSIRGQEPAPADEGLAVWARTVAVVLLAGILVAAWLWPRS